MKIRVFSRNESANIHGRVVVFDIDGREHTLTFQEAKVLGTTLSQVSDLVYCNLAISLETKDEFKP